MGCDIHPHIEYRIIGDNYWTCFADPNLGRNYFLFGILAGVRGGPPLYQPRGRVRNPSFCTKSADTLLVLPDEDYTDQEGCCSKSQADKWETFVNNTRTHVYYPYYHNHHWLTLQELREVQDKYIAELGEPNPMLTGVIGAMAALEYAMECETRLVFWFDS